MNRKINFGATIARTLRLLTRETGLGPEELGFELLGLLCALRRSLPTVGLSSSSATGGVSQTLRTSEVFSGSLGCRSRVSAEEGSFPVVM